MTLHLNYHPCWCSADNQSAGHQYRWLWPGNRTFLEVASMVVTWWIVSFWCSDSMCVWIRESCNIPIREVTVCILVLTTHKEIRLTSDSCNATLHALTNSWCLFCRCNMDLHAFDLTTDTSNTCVTSVVPYSEGPCKWNGTFHHLFHISWGDGKQQFSFPIWQWCRK